MALELGSVVLLWLGQSAPKTNIVNQPPAFGTIIADGGGANPWTVLWSSNGEKVAGYTNDDLVEVDYSNSALRDDYLARVVRPVSSGSSGVRDGSVKDALKITAPGANTIEVLLIQTIQGGFYYQSSPDDVKVLGNR